jgi:hypothetical protein
VNSLQRVPYNASEPARNGDKPKEFGRIEKS